MPDPVTTSAPAPGQKMLNLAMQLPVLYFNAFEVGVSATDVTIIGRLNNNAVSDIKLSYASAKSLADALSKSIAYYEKRTGTSVLSTEQITAKLAVTETKPQT